MTPALVSFFFSLLLGLFEGFELIGLPLDFINVLATITSYGVWVIGADLMAVFVSFIIGWWVIKFSIGIFLWVWELLPLT